jgi:RasGEF domain
VSSMGKMANAAGTPNLVMSDSPLPPPVLSTSLTSLNARGAGRSVTDINALDLARQFTIRESKIYCAVLPEELVGQEFRLREGPTRAINVRALSTLSSAMTAWVADSIMDKSSDINRCAAIIKHWIEVCSNCLSLYNYNSTYNIFCALESMIQRLKETWSLVPSEHKETMEFLRRLMDVRRHNAVYRDELRNWVPPCLPWMGLYLIDLTVVDEGNPNTCPMPGAPESHPFLINFRKHIETVRIISDVQRFQIPYRLQEDSGLQSWIDEWLSF